jgi:hypothetical protein
MLPRTALGGVKRAGISGSASQAPEVLWQGKHWKGRRDPVLSGGCRGLGRPAVQSGMPATPRIISQQQHDILGAPIARLAVPPAEPLPSRTSGHYLIVFPPAAPVGS